jgi:N-acetylglutamate synthase
MKIDDFEQVHSLWMEIHGFGIRSIDDSKEGVERFIRRNPTTSMVAVCDGKIVGAILCGHDGRRAGLYHVCVQENYRKHGIGQKLVERCLEALKAEKISKVNLIAFKQNEIGNRFWQSLGWKYCDNVNYYIYRKWLSLLRMSEECHLLSYSMLRILLQGFPGSSAQDAE